MAAGTVLSVEHLTCVLHYHILGNKCPNYTRTWNDSESLDQTPILKLCKYRHFCNLKMWQFFFLSPKGAMKTSHLLKCPCWSTQCLLNAIQMFVAHTMKHRLTLCDSEEYANVHRSSRNNGFYM